MKLNLLAGFVLFFLVFSISITNSGNLAFSQTNNSTSDSDTECTETGYNSTKTKFLQKKAAYHVAKKIAYDIWKEVHDLGQYPGNWTTFAKEKILNSTEVKDFKNIQQNYTQFVQSCDIAKEKLRAEIKDEIKERISAHLREELKERAIDLAKEKAKEIAEAKIREQELERAQQVEIEEVREAAQQRAGVDPDFDTSQQIDADDKERMIAKLKHHMDDLEEERQTIIDELKEKADYREKLFKAKLDAIGAEEFAEIKEKYKAEAIEKAKEHLENIREKVKSKELVAQLENGTYYGELEADSTNTTYKIQFQGQATNYSDETVKDASGDISLELISSSEQISKFKVIGGQILLTEPETAEVTQVFDISFGRARILSVDVQREASDILHVMLNAEDLDSSYHTIGLHAELEGELPAEIGQPPMNLTSHASGRSGISGLWSLDVGGTLAFDELIPEDAEELEDVAEDVQTEAIVEEVPDLSTEEVTSEIEATETNDTQTTDPSDLPEVEASADESPLSPEEIEQIRAEIAEELKAEVEAAAKEEIEEAVKEGVEEAQAESTGDN